jgi:hypothetical protein
MHQIYDDAFDSNEIKYINQVILDETLPWYYSRKTIRTNHSGIGDNGVFTHVLLNRYEATESCDVESRITSIHFDFFMNAFKQFCEKQQIKFENIFRMSLNLTFSSESKHGVVHIDHNFEHKNFILYLNEFTNGSTFIFKQKNIVAEIPAKKNRAVIFDGVKHAQGFCLPDEDRCILVATFL